MKRVRKLLGKTIIIVTFLSLLATANCTSSENIYRFESDCPVNMTARNIVIIHNKGTLTVGGYDDHGNFIPDRSVRFLQEKEVGFSNLSLNGYPDMSVEETVLDPNWGVMLQKGFFEIGSNGILPAQIPESEVPVGLPEGLYRACPDAYGSENVIILYGSGNSPSKFAGLWWLQREVVANVWKDGTVQVNRAGISAIDDNENKWISKMIGGGVDAIVMVKDE